MVEIHNELVRGHTLWRQQCKATANGKKTNLTSDESTQSSPPPIGETDIWSNEWTTVLQKPISIQIHDEPTRTLSSAHNMLVKENGRAEINHWWRTCMSINGAQCQSWWNFLHSVPTCVPVSPVSVFADSSGRGLAAFGRSGRSQSYRPGSVTTAPANQRRAPLSQRNVRVRECVARSRGGICCHEPHPSAERSLEN